MSRIDELKKQYPELNITMFDILSKLDKSKSYKYLPLICKIFGKRWAFDSQVSKADRPKFKHELITYLENKGIPTNGLTESSLYVYHRFSDEFISENFETMNHFMSLMDQNKIENNDVTSYKDMDEVRSAVSLANMKVWEKELEGQAHKEYEDDKWLMIRPLTFQSSCKYGSSTRWCTTYKNEKQYFERYWRRGILVYFINKLNGYKVAGFKALDGDTEFSFWDAEDRRVDFLEINIDDYLYSTIRTIFRSNLTNSDLCSPKIKHQVQTECAEQRIHKMSAEIREIGELQEAPRVNYEQAEMPMPIEERSYRYERNDMTVTEMPVYEDRPSIA
jgi:hypothetical protein